MIESIGITSDPGTWLVQAHVDGNPSSARVKTDFDFSYMVIEKEFFFLLSERGLAEVGSSAAFQSALFRLVRAVRARGLFRVALHNGAK